MSTLSKQKQKYILSLHNKKYRRKFGQFLVEGKKLIEELVNSQLEFTELYLSDEEEIKRLNHPKTLLAKGEDIQKVSFLKTNAYGIAVVNDPQYKLEDVLSDWSLLLDGVRDPGNLGTIVRLAHWYGIKYVFCSQDTVDYQNPKAISSTMGSFAHVKLVYTDLEKFISQNDLPVYMASMEGESVHKALFPSKGLLLMGSESHGISEELKAIVPSVIGIPAFGTTESLNVATATGIILDNIRRVCSHQTIR